MHLRHAFILLLFTILVGWGGFSSLQGQSATILAEYPLDNGEAVDVSGNGNNGRIIGNPAVVSGVIGQALLFDGVDDYLGVKGTANLQLPTIGISLWIRIPEVPVTDKTLITKVAGDVGFTLWLSGQNGTVHFGIVNTTSVEAEVESPMPVVPEVWTSITANYDGSEMELYMHGQLVATTSAAGIDITNVGKVWMGGRGGPNSFFEGLMDHIIITDGQGEAKDACQNALKLFHTQDLVCVDDLEDITDVLGVGDTEHRHFGINLVDINRDGWLDLYYPNGDADPIDVLPPTGECPDPADILPARPQNFNTLFMNNGDGTFTGDVAPDYGLDDWWNAMRHVFGDYDNDGMLDVISHNFVQSPLYHAVSMDPPLWVDASEEAGLELCLTRGTGASWVDVNNDGWLDLYAAEYDGSRLAVDHLNIMYLNNGDGTFTDITAAAGVNLPDNPMGVAFSDYDNDGDQDLFVTNSHEAPARLYRHEGLVGNIPQYVDVAPEAGVDVVGEAGRGFGAAWGDYNNDNLMDLLFTREADTRLFRNDGPNVNGVYTFTDVSNLDGLNFEARIYQDGNFADLNNDGWLDILLCNASTDNEPNRVFLNRAGTGWTQIAELVGMDNPTAEQQGVAPGDIDNDGDVDIVWYSHNLGHKNYVFENKHRGNNWVQFRLAGTVSNRDAVGAVIRVKAEITPGQNVIQKREIYAGTGFFADIPRLQTFGLGSAQIVKKVEISWPSGQLDVYENLAVNARYEYEETFSAGSAPAPADADLEGAQVPLTITLEQNYPNPFNPTTQIRFGIVRQSDVSLKVYDLLGHEVATLAQGSFGAGFHAVTWDGTDSRGHAVASGVYLYRLKAGSAVLAQKMLLSR